MEILKNLLIQEAANKTKGNKENTKAKKNMAQGSEHQLLGRKRKKETKTQRVVIQVNACG